MRASDVSTVVIVVAETSTTVYRPKPPQITANAVDLFTFTVLTYVLIP